MVTITTHSTRSMIAALALAFSAVFVAPIAGQAQSASDKPADPKAAGDKREGAGKASDRTMEIARRLAGQPAGKEECIWLGRRVLNRLWADDLDTAFRHLDLYDRFGCPGGHVQATFRCLVRQGLENDPKTPGLEDRIQVCWINPGSEPGVPAATAQSPEPGTTTR
jgi:hypothetical protein